MRKHLIPALLATACSLVLVSAQAARAADDSADTVINNNYNSTPTYDNSTMPTTTQQPGMGADAVAPVSTVDRSEVDRTPLQAEGVAFQPQVGMINYHDTLGNTANRMTYGLTADMNLPRILGNPDLYFGPQLGFFYSHLGSSNADFVGNSPATQASVGFPGANMFYIPTDLKLGINLGNFRPSIHGGANLIYRSAASAVAVSQLPVESQDSAWSYMPNFGLDLEFAVTKNFGLVARPDITFGGSNRIWTASIGASIPMG